jgi:hypothetical protein
VSNFLVMLQFAAGTRWGHKAVRPKRIAFQR